MLWYLRQLLPLSYRTRYVENGERHYVKWRMWLGRCYHIYDVVVK